MTSASGATEPIARFAGVSLDCPDPAALADFYLELPARYPARTLAFGGE